MYEAVTEHEHTNHLLRRVVELLERIDLTLKRVLLAEVDLDHKGTLIMAAIDDVLAEVQADTDVQNSAIKLLEGLSKLLADAGADPTKLAAIQTALTANRAALSAAITANTPVAPAPPVAPVAP